jgi:hypothetical protein
MAEGLWGVEAGARVLVTGRVTRSLQVERTTPTQIIAGGRRWRKQDGREIGAAWPEFIVVLDAAGERALFQQEREAPAVKIAKALNNVNWRYLNPDELLAVARRVLGTGRQFGPLSAAVAALEALDAAHAAPAV